METILAQLDFDSTGDLEPFDTTCISSLDIDDAVVRMEEASIRGDLFTVQAVFAQLHRLVLGEIWSKAPGSSLIYAVQNGHLAIVTFLLAFAIDHLDLTAWFLAHGANPNARCYLDITPMSAAMRYGPFTVIRMLFEHGGSLEHGQLLHYAVGRARDDRLDVLAYVLAMDLPINAVLYQKNPDSYNQRKAFGLGTALHDAADLGDVEVVRMLMKHGADPGIRDSLGQTPLDRAQHNGHISVVEHLRPFINKEGQGRL